MNRSSLLVSLLLVAVGATASAQDPSPPAKEAPPEAPLIASAPDNLQWTVAYTSKTPEKDPVTPDEVRNRKMRQRYSPLVVEKHVMKQNGQTVVMTTYEAGIKSEAWVVGGYLYELPYRPGDAIRVDTKGKGDFSEIYWITPENFRGTVEYKGSKMHLYETDAADPRQPSTQGKQPPAASPSGDAAKIRPQRAYIDAKTRLPRFVDTGRAVLTYQFSDAAFTFPTPDERIKKIMRESTTPQKH